MQYFVVPLVNLVASDMLIVIFKPEVYCICVICSKQKNKKTKKVIERTKQEEGEE